MGKGGEKKCHIFYAYDGLTASTDPVWLQGVFDTLAKFFGRVGIWKKNREDGRDNLPTVLCGRDPYGRSLKAVDDWGGTHLPGQTEAKGAMN